MEERFIKLPLPVLELSEWKGKSISPADKIVYAYMLSRIRYFCWQEGGEYYESQEDIATAVGISFQVVRRSILKWIDLGVIVASKVRYQGRYKWVYTNFIPISKGSDDDLPDW